ncbi:MAG: aminotransferase class V-fold PLP-dependent enzyme [Parcubacteria group bacterium]|nr:aminotransferase class V-fold PLP-dependent enzyme [Parcubacteria group bacterium]
MAYIDTKKIKSDFPIFGNVPEGFAYLDNAATSQTPCFVIDALTEYYTKHRANIHRGSYALAEEATARYEEARERIALFIGAEKEEIVVSGGATLASNMLILMLEAAHTYRAGEEIVTTVSEHHSLLVPLQELAERNGMVLRFAPLDKDGVVDEKAVVKLITRKTRIVAMSMASNVTGAVMPYERAMRAAKEAGAIGILDGTAYIGHAPVDMTTCSADAMFFSGHKMCGPTGVGILYMKGSLMKRLRPVFFGGGIVEEVTKDGARCTDAPYKFEAGTQPIAQIIGLGKAAEYLSGIGLEAISAHVRELVDYARTELESIPGVTLYAAPAEKNIGIVSFTVLGIHAHDIAHIAVEEGVALRAGHHCAEPLVRELGVVATVRASFYVYNTKEDVDALVCAIKKAQRVFT